MQKPSGLFLILYFTLILSSCGQNQEDATTSFSTTAIIAQTRSLNNTERIIATRICYAYQSKSKKFNTSEFLGTNFSFKTNGTDCQDTKKTQSVSTTLKSDSGTNLYYDPSNLSSNSKFYKKVQTDSSGYLSNICRKIFNNEVISNTAIQANYKIQITFFRDTLDGYYLQYYAKQSENVYKIESADKIKVLTQVDYTNGKILGMDMSFSGQKVCTDSTKFSNFEQSFISH